MPDGNSAESAGKSPHEPAPSAPTPEADAPIAHAPTGKQLERRQLWMWIAGGVLLLLALYEAIPWVITAFRTESTDDAYVNGHVTFVAPRVPGQVVRVLVDDNNRVHKGDSAGAARQGTIPGQGRYRTSGAVGCAGRICRSTGQGSGPGGVGAQPTVRSGTMRCDRPQQPGRRAARQSSRACKPRTPRSIKAQADYRAGEAALPRSRLYRGRNSIRSRKPIRWPGAAAKGAAGRRPDSRRTWAAAYTRKRR